MEIRRNHEHAKIYSDDCYGGHAGFGLPAALGLLAFFWVTGFGLPKSGVLPGWSAAPNSVLGLTDR